MIRELKTLLAVAREGTFAAAGQKIGLTQAAVSAQMQRLQAELGVTLFERTGRSARLTAMGRQTLVQAGELIALYNALGSRKTGGAPSVLLTIGAIASVQRSLLPDVLTRFHREYRSCRTRVMPGLSADLIDAVDAGELDMAVIIRPPFSLHGDLRWTTLAHEPFRLLVPRQVASNDWAQILATRFLRTAHVHVQDICEVDELDAIVRMVARGVGVALMPQTAAHRRWPAAVRAVDLGPHTFHRDIGLAHRSQRSLSEPVQRLLQLVREAYGVVAGMP
jgi:DNA-binding transcriptional LysR family regulator